MLRLRSNRANRAPPAASASAKARTALHPRGVKPTPAGVKPATVIDPNPLVVKGGRPKNLRTKPCLGMYKLVDAEWHLRTDSQYVRSRRGRVFSRVAFDWGARRMTGAST